MDKEELDTYILAFEILLFILGCIALVVCIVISIIDLLAK